MPSQSKSGSCTTSSLGSRVRMASFPGRSRRDPLPHVALGSLVPLSIVCWITIEAERSLDSLRSLGMTILIEWSEMA